MILFLNTVLATLLLYIHYANIESCSVHNIMVVWNFYSIHNCYSYVCTIFYFSMQPLKFYITQWIVIKSLQYMLGCHLRLLSNFIMI